MSITNTPPAWWSQDPERFNRPSTERFLTLLDESAESFTFQSFDDLKDRKDATLARVIHGSLDDHWESLCTLSQRGAGVFVTVNKTSGRGRKKADITAIRALWRELDRPGVPELPIEPHVIVESSSGKFHQYLLIDESDDFKLFSGIMDRLVADFGSDPSAADVSRVLRLPGFPHQKDPDRPWLVRIIHESGMQPYSLEEVAKAIPPLTRPTCQQDIPAGKGIKNMVEVRSALAALDPDMEYREWLAVGMALHHATSGGKQGLQLWDQWSSEGTLYKQGECLYRYASFGKRNGQQVTLKTLFKMANEAGWRWHSDTTASSKASNEAVEPPAPKQFPSLSADALYGLSGEVVSLCTKDSEADPAAILFSFLTWFGAAVGNSPRVMIGDTAHCARLFTPLVGNTSRARKGTSKSPVQRLMNAAQGVSLALPGPILPLLKPVAKVDGPLSSGEGLIYAVRDPRENSKGEVDDAGVTDKRLLVVEGEFGAALRAMQREGNTLSTTLRVAWDMAQPWDVLSPITKSNRIAATNPHICIIGHITKTELTNLLSAVDLHGGLANRLLWVCVRRQKPVPIPPPLEDTRVAELGRRIAATLKTAQQTGVVPLTTAATQEWIALYEELTADNAGAFGAATSRAEAQTIRLALHYALLDGAKEIDRPHIRAAKAAWDYCNESARYLFGDAEADPASNRILDALREGPKTQTELFGLFDRNLSKAKLTALLEHLQEAGRITCQQQKQEAAGRPSTVWIFLR